MDGFVKISRYAGMREDLIQAGGGNTSVKLPDGRMAVKASGFQLADVTEGSGFALVDYKKISEGFLRYEDLDAMTEEEGKKILSDAFIEGGRPSIETFLHAVSGKYTLHTHPVVVNALTCRKDGMETLKNLFPDSLNVSYTTPGVKLAKAYFKAYRASGDRPFDIVFLQNHGLVVSCDSADEVIERTEEVVKKIEEHLGIDQSPYHELTKIWGLFPEKVVWKVTDRNVLREYEEAGHWNCSFCPDGVVFLGKGFLTLHEGSWKEDVDDFLQTKGFPAVIDCKGSLYIVADSVKKALEIQSVLSFCAQVMSLNRGKESILLDEAEQDFLLDWDAEKFRKKMK